MAQRFPHGYVLDLESPQAPTRAQWDAMTPEERKRVVDALPTSLPIHLNPPEGDIHRRAKERAFGALDDFFRRAGRRIYLSSELIVFYPGERSFVPDLIAVLDVEAHDRTRWVVDVEGKGLDFVLEVLVDADPRKDLELNVERYAALGIPEYFVFDRGRMRLHSYRLAAEGRVYERIVPQLGRYPSRVLGLDLALVGERLRFFAGSAQLEDTDEMIARLGSMLDNVMKQQDERERLERELAEERAGREQERAKREELERAMALLIAENERLKKV
jgi:Uma2 family endonuclease